jgi:hypothetical protein
MTEENKTRKPYQTGSHYRYSFRDWIRDQFPDLKRHTWHDGPVYDELKQRFTEVFDAASVVFQILHRSRSAYISYYAEDEVKLNQAFEAHDVRAFAQALDVFVDAIDVE